MPQNNNILQELIALNSSLRQTGMPYAMPNGYFEDLPGQVLNRIKALEASSAKEELGILSPIIAVASPLMPFDVPEGYFEALPEKIRDIVIAASKPANEELKEISPLLSNLEKAMPYEIPGGYFDNLPVSKKEKQGGVFISMFTKSLVRYAAAALVGGILLTIGIIFYTKPVNPEKALAKFEKKLENEIKKTSDQELNDFLKFMDSSQDMAVNQAKDETKNNLLDDVSSAELIQFLDEVADPDFDTDENPLLN